MKVALVGLARSGKDTVADILQKQYPKLFTNRYALADPIRNIINTLVGVSDEVAATQKDIELTYSINLSNFLRAGKIFQEVFRGHKVAFDYAHYWGFFLEHNEMAFHEGVHVYKGSLRHLYQQLGTEYARSFHNNIWLDVIPESTNIITDVRFDNEAEFLQDEGYLLIKIERQNTGVDVKPHISEKGVSVPYDVYLDNNGTLEDLKAQLTPEAIQSYGKII